VPEADAQERHLAGKALDRVDANAGVVRGAGAGGDDDALRRHVVDVLEADLVVAKDLHLLPQLAEVLVEVVGKAVVVID
jgi:hypothetical protein